MPKAQIYPSLMSADLLNLEKVIKTLEPHCDGFHIDIMDNHFVPNLTWGPDLTNAIAKATKKPLLVHLMVEKPEDMITKFKLTPQSIISFHLEATQTPQVAISAIKKAGYMPSIAIKPKTPIKALYPWIDEGLPHILLMSVEPGFSGQAFIESSVDRLKELVAHKRELQKDVIISMDGGITKNNIGILHRLGAEQFAVASGIFGEPDAVAALKGLYQAID